LFLILAYDNMKHMIINWKGQSCFSISTSPNKNGQISIVVDPYGKETGLRVPKLQADVLLVTHDHEDHNNIQAVSGDYLLINGPGEYDVKDIIIQGIHSFHDNEKKEANTIYIIEAEGIRICHLGDLGEKDLSSEQLDKIGDVDILMIPIGGTYTINSVEAVKIMGQIEPKIIIPMHYHIPDLKYKLEKIDDFLKALGIKKIEKMPKLSIKSKDISSEEVKVIQLEP